MRGMAPRGIGATGGRLGEGRCPVSLTGALVRCSDAEGIPAHGGGLDDLGLGLVVDGSYPAAAEVLDLGSGRRRTLDLDGPAVVMGWVPPESVKPVGVLLEERRSGDNDEGSSREHTGPGFSLVLDLLRRRGIDPLTLPVILRMGFLDVCRDLDPHEHAAVRFHVAPRGVARAQLEPERATLRVAASRDDRDGGLRRTVEAAFPGREVRREQPDELAGFSIYRVGFPLPTHLPGARALMAELRDGLMGLLARFDSDRHRTVKQVLETFGSRDTLRLLEPGTPEHSAGGEPHRATTSHPRVH